MEEMLRYISKCECQCECAVVPKWINLVQTDDDDDNDWFVCVCVSLDNVFSEWIHSSLSRALLSLSFLFFLTLSQSLFQSMALFH